MKNRGVTDISIIAIDFSGCQYLYRWFRFERVTEPGLDQLVFYSGARGRTPYAAYQVNRHRNGRYALVNHRTGETITESRTLHSALNKLPDDFYYST